MDAAQAGALLLRCPRCGRELDEGQTACSHCKREVLPFSARRGDWRTDNRSGRYYLVCNGAEYVVAAALISVAIVAIRAASLGERGIELVRGLHWLWIALPFAFLPLEALRSQWYRELLPGFLYPLSVLSMIVGLAIFFWNSDFAHVFRGGGLGSIFPGVEKAALAGGVPILFTILLGGPMGRLWNDLEPFRGVGSAIRANALTVLTGFVPMLLVALLFA